MKLIDLLVQELPKRGGWPEGAQFIAADMDGRIDSYVAKPEIDESGKSWRCSSGAGYHGCCFNQRVEDWSSSVVSIQQYEGALEASKKADWNGEGLPPVGCECELVNFYGNDFPEFVGEHGEEVKIIGSGFTNGCPVAFYEADGGRGGMLAYAVEQCFRPIRTEAERKREEAIRCLSHSLRAYGSISNEQLQRVYDDIAAGVITGVKLED